MVAVNWAERSILLGECKWGTDAVDRAIVRELLEAKTPAATTVYVILRAVDNLKTLPAPILPHTAQKLHEYLAYEGQLFGTQHVVEYQEETRTHQALTYDHSRAIGTWTPSQLPAEQALHKPAPKVDEGVPTTRQAQPTICQTSGFVLYSYCNQLQ